jgi:hypothetical protein
MSEHDEGVELNRIKRTIGFGFDVEAFLKSDIGVYLSERAESERQGALEQLALVDADDTKKIRALQQQIAVVDSWQQWLAEAVNEGIAAQGQLVQAMGN